MAVNLVYRFQDGESNSKLDSMALTFPATPALATLQAYADGLTPLVDALTGSQVAEINATYALTVAAGAKGAPVAGSLNERGGLIGFQMSIENVIDSLRIPAILPTIMAGNEFSVTTEPVLSFVNYVIGTQEGIEAVNRWITSYEAALYGKRSIRRK